MEALEVHADASNRYPTYERGWTYHSGDTALNATGPCLMALRYYHG